jgi:hypothetical protein
MYGFDPLKEHTHIHTDKAFVYDEDLDLGPDILDIDLNIERIQNMCNQFVKDMEVKYLLTS